MRSGSGGSCGKASRCHWRRESDAGMASWLTSRSRVLRCATMRARSRVSCRLYATSANPALCRLLARDAETLLVSSFQELTHPDDLAADVEQFERALAGEIDSYQISKRYLLPDGGIVWGLLTLTIVRDASDAPQHFVAQVQDITDRKTSQGELRRYAAQLQALSKQDPVTGL